MEKNEREYCDYCDGCGWYEGGKSLKTECEKCHGTGIKVPNEFIERHLKAIKKH